MVHLHVGKHVTVRVFMHPCGCVCVCLSVCVCVCARVRFCGGGTWVFLLSLLATKICPCKPTMITDKDVISNISSWDSDIKQQPTIRT